MIFLLAALLACLGAALLWVESSRNAASNRATAEPQTKENSRPLDEDPAPAGSSDHDATSAADTTGATIDDAEVETPALNTVGVADTSDEHIPETAEHQPAPVEIDDLHTEAALDHLPETHADYHDTTVEYQPETIAETPEDFESPHIDHSALKVDPVDVGGLKKSTFPSFPGAARRERKAWATRRGFDYSKSDEFLTDEWNRGPGAPGAALRDVVSGMAAGYEMHLGDLGGVTVMAMRRKAGSDVIIDVRRTSNTAETPSDLVSVMSTQGFQFLSTEPTVAQRFIDDRVLAALHLLQLSIQRLWLESDWVVAQTIKNSSAEQWEIMQHPLAVIADAACTLPPPGGATPALDFHDSDPSRAMPAAPHVDDDEDDGGVPPIVPIFKPKEGHVVLPSRTRSQTRGVVSEHNIGLDAINPIANGTQPTATDFSGLRVVRDTSAGSSIFNDATDDDAANDDIADDDTTVITGTTDDGDPAVDTLPTSETSSKKTEHTKRARDGQRGDGEQGDGDHKDGVSGEFTETD